MVVQRGDVGHLCATIVMWQAMMYLHVGTRISCSQDHDGQGASSHQLAAASCAAPSHRQQRQVTVLITRVVTHILLLELHVLTADGCKPFEPWLQHRQGGGRGRARLTSRVVRGRGGGGKMASDTMEE